MQRLFLLNGKVQFYGWGGFHFIPSLLNIPNPEERPFAEYWLGAHPALSATIGYAGKETTLHDYIQANPRGTLGALTAEKFASLPFLLKVLDVRQMLSIQVHPDLVQGREGFERENAQGIPVDAPHRNYKDANHKPELMVALGDFWLLHGFKPEAELRETLETVTELRPLLPAFETGGYKGLYESVMVSGSTDIEVLLAGLQRRVLPAYDAGTLQRSSPDFWAARAFRTFNAKAPDRGIFSIYFFNLLHVRKGEGLFQDAGLPHAYLEGQNIEIMANSDNVLRAGLTDKHVDVAELMKLVKFEATKPAIIPATADDLVTYKSPAAEFELSRLALSEGTVREQSGEEATVLLVMAGSVNIHTTEGSMRLERGQAAFCAAGDPLSIAADADAVVFSASVPVRKN
ncbi:MAG: manA [Flaviaesturariibacter sp.]|nr:manA [Flaviaesturariibacter sp.]